MKLQGWMSHVLGNREQRKRVGSHPRYGSARPAVVSFEALETRTLLSATPLPFPSVCLAPGVHASTTGEIFFIDDFQSIDDLGVPSSTDSNVAWPSPVPAQRLPALHSDAGAPQKIYLDFDGHTVQGTGWNEWNLGRAIHAPAFDIDGDPATFNGQEWSVIHEVWSRVAEDFAPFAIDVTTESPSARSFQRGAEAIRVLVTTNVDEASGRTWMHSGNGVAYLNSWRSSTDTPVWVFANRLGYGAKRIAESVSHELGHAFGLHHDGRTASVGEDEEYFAGHGEGTSGWAPIMGLGYHRTVTQWDRGEYHLSNNDERDIQIIASEANGIHLRPDDVADHIIFAKPLESVVGRLMAEGLIATRDDRDAYRMQLAAGTVDLLVAPATTGANLNLSVSLYGPRGQLIKTFFSEETRPVEASLSVGDGTYYVVIDGVGDGDPERDGYSDYGSIGRYTVRAVNTPEAAALDRIRSAAKRLLG